MAVSETWLDKDKVSDVELDGYELFVMNREDKKGGGVAIYVDSNLQSNLVNNMSTTIDNVLECVTVEVKIEKQKNVTVSCMYRTPGSPLEIFNEFIADLYQSQSANRTYIVCGDFNVNLLNPGEHKGTTDFINTFYNITLFPVIVKPSRITTTSATLIDNIFTNKMDQLDAGLLITDISDHLPVFAVFQNVFKVNSRSIYESRIVRHRTPEAIEVFKEELGRQNWDDVYSYENPNEAYDIFLEKILNIYDKCCPLKAIKVNHKIQKPWFTKGIIKACKKKNILYRKFLKSRTRDAENKYKEYKNKLVNIIRNSKKEYYTKLLIEHKQNIQGTWKVLNSVIHKRKYKGEYPNHFIKDNRIIILLKIIILMKL